jgi:hypothetical protein
MSTILESNQSNESATLITTSEQRYQLVQSHKSPKFSFNLLQPIRQWLDGIEIENAELAHFVAKAIPAQCPFERDINLFGRKVMHIPPLCKLNPFYEQLVGLRFRALCFLADRCGEDIQSYCC